MANGAGLTPGTYIGTIAATAPGGATGSPLSVQVSLVVVPPQTLPDRLRSAGFADVGVDVGRSAFRFSARKPALKP